MLLLIYYTSMEFLYKDCVKNYDLYLFFELTVDFTIGFMKVVYYIIENI